jgi:hypothetical protein
VTIPAGSATPYLNPFLRRWNDEHTRHLDDDEVARVRVAMQIRRGRLEPEEGLTRLT